METSSLNTALSTYPMQQSSAKPPRPILNPYNEIQDRDLISLFNNTLLPRWQEKYKLGDSNIKALKFTVDNFLDDRKFMRILCAMGNETAVAIEESMKQWGFPKWLSNTLYYGFWAASIASSGARAILRGLGTANVKTFTETAIQDLVAAFIGPTGAIMLADKAQNMLYQKTKLLPQSVVSFIRPIISVGVAAKSMTGILDPIGKSLGRGLSGMISPEKYKGWSESIGAKIETLMGTSLNSTKIQALDPHLS